MGSVRPTIPQAPPGATASAPAFALARPAPADITQWLSQVGGDGEAAAQLFELLYDELRRAAGRQLRREAPGHTLSATGLAHEAWLKLALQQRTRWANRGHFMAVAATLMRRILVNHAAARQAAKRQGERWSLTLAEAEGVAAPEQAPEVLALHEALRAFERLDPRAAQVVELRFFGGLEHEEVAEALGLSLATVKRDWALARAWLQRELRGGGPGVEP